MSDYPLLTIRQFFWDYVCPFSRKSGQAVETILKPLLETPQYAGKVKIIMRPHPQPWHSSSTLVHEAALAVAKVAPGSFWKYTLELLKEQEQFYDIPAATMTAAQAREKAAEIGLSAGILSAEEVAAVKDLLLLKGTPNGGCAVTNDLKACSE